MSHTARARQLLFLVSYCVWCCSGKAAERNVQAFLPVKASSTHAAADGNLGSPRTTLVVAAIGDSSIHERWFEGFANATWDLAAFYFGAASNFTCSLCVYTESGSGTKWSFLYKFARSEIFQHKFAKQYKQLYVPDDDIAQTAASMSRAFALMHQYGLHLAQPSLCSGYESVTWQQPLHQDPRVLLQFSTFVEIMVPIFSMNFFTSQVLATLENAQTGYGLDWVWPYLLGYPQDQIAVIKDVCVVHPKKDLQPKGKVTMYEAHHPAGEQQAVLAQFKYDVTVLRNKFGMAEHEIAWLGVKWQPWYQQLMTMAGITDVYAEKNSARGPHKGCKLISTGSTIAAKLRRRQVRTTRQASKLLNEQATHQVTNSGRTRHLVVIVVPERSRWLRYSASAQYDTLAIASQQYMLQVEQACQHCVMVYGHSLGASAGRYAALHELSQDKQWQELVVTRYDYIYFPEDDVIQTVDAINRMFQVIAEHNLSLAQPSWCSLQDTLTKQPDLQMNSMMTLRYTTYVENVAPVWSRKFWNEHVVSALKNADQGCGLDFAWPYLAGYPANQVGVIDDICAMHPVTIKGPSQLIKATKLSQETLIKRCLAEEHEALALIDYQPFQRYLLDDRPHELMNWVLKPWYKELLSMHQLKVKPIHAYTMHLYLDDTPDEAGTM